MPTKSEPKAERPQQEKCTGCNHSASFHARGKCMVMGCICKKWNGPKVLTRKERDELARQQAEEKEAKRKK